MSIRLRLTLTYGALFLLAGLLLVSLNYVLVRRGLDLSAAEIRARAFEQAGFAPPPGQPGPGDPDAALHQGVPAARSGTPTPATSR